MAVNQDVQEELFQLVKAEMKNEKEIGYESLKRLKFLDAFLKETQRLYTTAVLLGRECDEDTVVKGIHIEKVAKYYILYDTSHDIPFVRKCVREDQSVGGNIMNPIRYPIINITAYAWVLSDTISLQWIKWPHLK